MPEEHYAFDHGVEIGPAAEAGSFKAWSWHRRLSHIGLRSQRMAMFGAYFLESGINTDSEVR
jgi:hypothetical protein